MSNGALPLYASRPVLNGEELVDWAKSQGYETTVQPDDMHVTTLASRRPFSVGLSSLVTVGKDWSNVVATPIGVKRLGADGTASVLALQAPQLVDEFQAYQAMGASHDWPEYQPHLTVSYQGGPETVTELPEKVVLGEPRFSIFTPDGPGYAEKGVILKVDAEERIVYGWASVSTVNGELITDKQGDQITPATMEKMATRFMENVRTAKAMHQGQPVGEVVHSFPMTKQLQELLGVYSPIEGWIVGMKVHDDEVWKLVKDGTLKAFSIGGKGKRIAL